MTSGVVLRSKGKCMQYAVAEIKPEKIRLFCINVRINLEMCFLLGKSCVSNKTSGRYHIFVLCFAKIKGVFCNTLFLYGTR